MLDYRSEIMTQITKNRRILQTHSICMWSSCRERKDCLVSSAQLLECTIPNVIKNCSIYSYCAPPQICNRCSRIVYYVFSGEIKIQVIHISSHLKNLSAHFCNPIQGVSRCSATNIRVETAPNRIMYYIVTISISKCSQFTHILNFN